MEGATDQLEHLTLSNVHETGRKIGAGAYGKVVEVRVSGLKCAGKKLHSLFFDQSSPNEQRAIRSRFVEECVTLSKLRHPNIVQLIGVHVIRGTNLPMMVMELLPGSLSDCLKRHDQIPGHIKTSILYDVSLGLLYLHRQTPPLIHRDLTANNVLLTSNMSAKLADLGVAKIVNLNPAQLTAHMTQCPGTLPYMPPEALSDQPVYDEKLDVFSFGNLILHVCTQQWPLPAPFLVYDPENPGIPKPLTEVQRRQKYLDMIAEQNSLKALSERCLQNFPSQRPSTANIASYLERIHDTNGSSAPNYLEMAMEIQTLKSETAQLRQQNLMLTQEAHEKDAIIAQLRTNEPSTKSFTAATTTSTALTLSHGMSSTATLSSATESGCPICLEKYPINPVKTPCCQQILCKGCSDRVIQTSPYCAICRKLQRAVCGNQPTNATMSHSSSNNYSLPGYPGFGMITITYYIPDGIQTHEHPNPGKQYRGTSRTAYLPNNAEGREVLRLLQRAFKVRLIFTVGTSHTSGLSDVVTWNDIHHKTSTSAGPFGYPDPTYLARVKQELKEKGIF